MLSSRDLTDVSENAAHNGDGDDDGDDCDGDNDVNVCADDCYLVMKVLLVKEVMPCDVSPVAMFTL